MLSQRFLTTLPGEQKETGQQKRIESNRGKIGPRESRQAREAAECRGSFTKKKQREESQSRIFGLLQRSWQGLLEG